MYDETRAGVEALAAGHCKGRGEHVNFFFLFPFPRGIRSSHCTAIRAMHEGHGNRSHRDKTSYCWS